MWFERVVEKERPEVGVIEAGEQGWSLGILVMCMQVDPGCKMPLARNGVLAWLPNGTDMNDGIFSFPLTTRRPGQKRREHAAYYVMPLNSIAQTAQFSIVLI